MNSNTITNMLLYGIFLVLFVNSLNSCSNGTKNVRVDNTVHTSSDTVHVHIDNAWEIKCR